LLDYNIKMIKLGNFIRERYFKPKLPIKFFNIYKSWRLGNSNLEKYYMPSSLILQKYIWISDKFVKLEFFKCLNPVPVIFLLNSMLIALI
jgi:hypothetical protein